MRGTGPIDVRHVLCGLQEARDSFVVLGIASLNAHLRTALMVAACLSPFRTHQTTLSQCAKAWFWRGKARMDAGDLDGSATDLQEVRAA